jgi:hypothetical protein
VYSILRAFHNVFFHPLANIPGPKLRGAFHFPHYYELCRGDGIYNWKELHEQYGDLVRLSPDTVTAINPGAWRGMRKYSKTLIGSLIITYVDIYGHANKQPMQKCPLFYYQGEGDAADIICSSLIERWLTALY